MNFATLDLNLLRVFDAVIEERSVTRAAHRLHVTQSAVSHALARLRELVGDELFLRTPEGMHPTARARAIAPRLQAGLAQLQAALTADGFDPATATRVFTLAVDPYARAVLLPEVIARLREAAPHVELRIRPGFAGAADALDDGRLDVTLASYRSIPERFAARTLFEERLVWALRADHPGATAPLTLEVLSTLPHLVRVLSDGEDADDVPQRMGHGLVRRAVQDDDGALRRALAGIGRQRSIHLTIPDSLAALAIVGRTDLAALVPERMGQALAGHFGLRLLEPPYVTAPIPISAVWRRANVSPGLAWLVALLTEAACTLTGVAQPGPGCPPPEHPEPGSG